MQNTFWFVVYNVRPKVGAPLREVRVTVVGSGHDEAYDEGRRDMQEQGFIVDFPVSATPVSAA